MDEICLCAMSKQRSIFFFERGPRKAILRNWVCWWLMLDISPSPSYTLRWLGFRPGAVPSVMQRLTPGRDSQSNWGASHVHSRIRHIPLTSAHRHHQAPEQIASWQAGHWLQLWIPRALAPGTSIVDKSARIGRAGTKQHKILQLMWLSGRKLQHELGDW
jgi:hypothetical protein